MDWRGVRRLNEHGNRIDRTEPPPSPVTVLARNAPYRLHVATSDGASVKITDAFTLERRKIFKGGVRGLAFSSDGHWLYVAHGKGRRLNVTAVEVQSARKRPLGTLRLKAKEALMKLRGHGNAERPHVSALVGVGAPWGPGQRCSRWRRTRLLRLRSRAGTVRLTEEPAPDQRRPWFKRSRSPNTHLTAELAGGLTMFRHGAGNQQINVTAPARAVRGAKSLKWMRDSHGLWLMTDAKGRDGCAHLRGALAFRLADRKDPRRRKNWSRWAVPSNLQLTRGDLRGQPLSVAPDGMRLLGISPAGVMLIEPSSRPESPKVSMIAPPSQIWPAFRPGVRSLLLGASEHREVALLLEQGALKRAAKLLAAAAKTAETATLNARLQKLRAVRVRRVVEFSRYADGTWAAALPDAATTTDSPSSAPSKSP